MGAKQRPRCPLVTVMTKDEIVEVFKLTPLQGGKREQIEAFKELYAKALESYALLSPSQRRAIDAVVSKERKNDS